MAQSYGHALWHPLNQRYLRTYVLAEGCQIYALSCFYLGSPAHSVRRLADRKITSSVSALSCPLQTKLSLPERESEDDSEDISCNPMAVQCIHIMRSACLQAFHGHIPVRLTIDSGATGNMIRAAWPPNWALKSPAVLSQLVREMASHH